MRGTYQNSVPRGGRNVDVAGSNHLICKANDEHPVNDPNLIVPTNVGSCSVSASVTIKPIHWVERLFQGIPRTRMTLNYLGCSYYAINIHNGALPKCMLV
jgi:hypothetical protein